MSDRDESTVEVCRMKGCERPSDAWIPHESTQIQVCRRHYRLREALFIGTKVVIGAVFLGIVYWSYSIAGIVP